MLPPSSINTHVDPRLEDDPLNMEADPRRNSVPRTQNRTGIVVASEFFSFFSIPIYENDGVCQMAQTRGLALAVNFIASLALSSLNYTEYLRKKHLINIKEYLK